MWVGGGGGGGGGSSARGRGVRAGAPGLRPRALGRPFMSPLALALDFRVRGAFVTPSWLALGVGRAARAAVSFVQ